MRLWIAQRPVISPGLMWGQVFRKTLNSWHARSVRQVVSKRSGKTSAMAQIMSVRCVEGDERLQMSLKYSFDNGRERVFNFDRAKDEELHRTFDRISTNMSKVVLRKEKKKKKKARQQEKAASTATTGGTVTDTETGSTDPADTVTVPVVEQTDPMLPVCLLHDSQKVDDNLPNVKAWIEGAKLAVGDLYYTVCINLPFIKSMSLPDNIMAGSPVYPKVDAEFVNLEECHFVWYKEQPKPKAEPCSPETADQGAAKKPKKRHSHSEVIEWEEVHRGFHYVPTNGDIGSKLRVVCEPVRDGRQGDEKDVITKCEVTAGPGLCPFENRHQFTQKRTGEGSFRIMTYNILADRYADSDYTRNVLYPYCPPYALEIDYRKQLLMKELHGYNADIMCLQEVDKKLFMHDLSPVLELEGFEGHFKMKTGQVPEGCAVFFRKSKFRLIGQHDMDMVESLKEDELFKDLLEKVSRNDLFKEKMMDRTTTVQVVVLESTEDPRKKLIVTTTHLFFHPRAPHVRVMQTAICLRHIERVTAQYAQDGPVAVIFCGDLNSYPEGGVHHFIDKKHIPAHHADWYAGGKLEFAEGMDMSHSLSLTSASGFPRYTNYVTGFSGCLDYIYVNEHLNTERVIPMPTHEEVTQHTALPSVVFPSDHIAVICDLAWAQTPTL